VTLSSVGTTFAVTLFAALILQLIPLPENFIYWRPDFLLLVTVGWIIFSSDSLGIVFAGLMGLLADFIFGSPTGLHMLLFAMVGAIPLFLSGWLTYFTLAHRCGFIFCLVVFYQLMSNIFFSLWALPVNYEYILVVALISSLIWPLLDRLLSAVNYKY